MKCNEKSTHTLTTGILTLVFFVCCVTSITQADTFGILSETIPGLKLDDDSKLGVYSGRASIELSDDAVEKREGNVSLKAQISVSSGGWVGWFVQWGLWEDPEDKTIDLSAYKDGSLRFWVKTPVELKVGIRSSNVSPGKETMLLLSNYAAIDNQWHPVVIPITKLSNRDFGGNGNTNLSKVKVLFNIARVSSTSKTNFWVDNVRWDMAMPGPLDRITISPDTALVPLVLTRHFFTQGFDANGNLVDIWPSWTVPEEIGSVNPTEGISTIFTASMTKGSGILETSAEGKTGNASLDICEVNFKSFTIYSDDELRGSLEVFRGEDDTLKVTEDEVTSAEGAKSLRGDFDVTSDGYGGWYVLAKVDDPEDLTSWDDYLHFWVKTAYDLEISIRSYNIDAEEGKAIIFLSDYGIPLDDTWQEVFIALPDFKQKEPNLDFSRMLIYFSVAIVGSKAGVDGIGSFWMDDIKWQAINIPACRAAIKPLPRIENNQVVVDIQMEAPEEVAGFAVDMGFSPALELVEGSEHIEGEGISDTRVVATLKFRIWEGGEVEFNLKNGQLTCLSGEINSPTLEDASILVVASPNWEINKDYVVDIRDLVIVGKSFNESILGDPRPNPDVTRDGVVDISDLVLVGFHFGEVYSAVPEAAPSLVQLDWRKHSDISAVHLPLLLELYEELKKSPDVSPEFLKTKRVIQELISLADGNSIPTEDRLEQNYPNPFNPETWLPYQLAADAPVVICIYDVRGQLVRTINIGQKAAGFYLTKNEAARWDGRDENGIRVASGVYFYQIKAGNFIATRKMAIIK